MNLRESRRTGSQVRKRRERGRHDVDVVFMYEIVKKLSLLCFG